jgi:hypothetical protein
MPASVEATILRALAKRPEDRFTSASALAQEFSVGLRETNPALPVTVSSASLARTHLARDVAVAQAAPAPDSAMTVADHADEGERRQTHISGKRGGRRVIMPALLGVLAIAVIVAALLGSRLLAAPPASTASGAHFVAGRTYTYNTVIGHSLTTSLTNDDVSVTLISLRTAPQGTAVVVGFDDIDSSKRADFLFQSRTNVYLLDNDGVRYAAQSATPDELIFGPRQQATTEFTFAPLSASTETLALYVNTDHTALAVPCTQVSPTAATAGCPS